MSSWHDKKLRIYYRGCYELLYIIFLRNAALQKLYPVLLFHLQNILNLSFENILVWPCSLVAMYLSAILKYLNVSQKALNIN